MLYDDEYGCLARIEQRFDVVAVNQKTLKVRLLAENKSEISADAVVSMAILRRGVEEEFFAPVSSGKYRDGDKWRGK